MSPTNDHSYPQDEGLQPAGVSVKILIGQAIERRWTFVLRWYEIRLLQRICDLTLQWGQPYIETTMRALVDGRAGRGEWRMGPIDFGRTTADKALAGLCERGLVETHTVSSPETGAWIGQRFTPNVALILKPWEIEPVAPTLATPKRLKAELPTSREGGTRETGRGYSRDGKALPASREHNTGTFTDTYTGTSHGSASAAAAAFTDADASDHGRVSLRDPSLFDDATEALLEKQNEKAGTEKSDAITSVKGSMAKIAAENAAKRATRLQSAGDRIRQAKPWVQGKRATKDVIQGADLETVWSETCAATSPDGKGPCAWTKKERGLAMALFSRWHHTNGHFDDFLVWCITEWHAISVKELGWMKSRPEVPSLIALHQFFDKFLNAWIVRDRVKQASRFDIDEVTELRLKGHSYDQAIAKVVQRKVKSAVRTLQPAALPPARVRQKPQPVRPVATETALKPTTLPATSKLRDKINRMDPAAIERALWGDKGDTEA